MGTSAEQKLNQIMDASSMTAREVRVQNGLLSPDMTDDIPYKLQSSKRKGGDTIKTIIIPEATLSFIIDCAQSAFVSTSLAQDHQLSGRMH